MISFSVCIPLHDCFYTEHGLLPTSAGLVAKISVVVPAVLLRLFHNYLRKNIDSGVYKYYPISIYCFWLSGSFCIPLNRRVCVEKYERKPKIKIFDIALQTSFGDKNGRKPKIFI